MTRQTGAGPWDLELEVVDILAAPGCGWNYSPGFRTIWDGRHYPSGMCPFAWNAFSPLIWALRYAPGHRSLGIDSAAEMTLVCPDSRHQVVWRVRRLEAAPATRAPGGEEPGTVWKLRIACPEERGEVDGLPEGPGCDRGYRVADGWDYDGQMPPGFCPLAWHVLSLWVWPLRYGGSPRPMEWEGDSVRYNCPNARNPVVFHVYRTGASTRTLGGA